MGVLDDIFGSSSNPAVPSGNLTKPLIDVESRARGAELHLSLNVEARRNP